MLTAVLLWSLTAASLIHLRFSWTTKVSQTHVKKSTFTKRVNITKPEMNKSFYFSFSTFSSICTSSVFSLHNSFHEYMSIFYPPIVLKYIKYLVLSTQNFYVHLSKSETLDFN